MLVARENDQFVPATTSIVNPAPVQGPPIPDPTIAQTFGAAFRQDNSIASFLTEKSLGDNAIDPDYNFQDGVVGTKYEAYINKFASETFNKNQQAALMSQIDQEEDDKNTLRAAGWTGTLAELTAGAFDPVNFIPVGGELYRGARVAETIGKSALRFAGAGALGAGASELALQSTQQTRPLSESALAIGGGAILGGLLGAGAGAYIGRKEMTRLAKSVETHMTTELPDQQAANEEAMSAAIGNQSVGAAAVNRDTIDDLSVAPGMGGLAKATADSTAPLNPLLRTLASPSLETRRIATDLMENPIYMKKNLEGNASAPAVETLMKEFTQGGMADALDTHTSLYNEFRKNGGTLSRADFNIQVAQAMRRGDQSADPFVARAAQSWRQKIFDPLKQRAIDAGLLPPDVSVDTADSYFTRIYNTAKIEANEGAFKGVVRDWLDGEISKIEAATAKANAAAEKAERSVPDFVSAADRQSYVDEVTNNIFNTVTGRNVDEDLPRDIVAATRGPLKERTFNIPDHMIEPYLHSDVEDIAERYTRTMAADIELKNKFGSTTLKDKIEAVQADYTKLREQLATDKTLSDDARAKKLAKLSKSEKNDVRDIRAVRDMLRGNYMVKENATNFARIAAAAGTINYLRVMGGIVASSATDLARHQMVHGLSNVMHDGLVPLISNLKGFRLSAKEAKLAGTISERIRNTRLATWSEILDPYNRRSPVERFLQNLARGFSKVNGMVYWNDFQKSFASVLTQARVLRGAEKYGSLKPREKAYLAFLGIDEDMAERISRQFQRHGMTESGVRVANSSDWTDDLARRVYRAAINKDVDSVIVTKGVGDTPLFSHTPIGRAMFQFQGFTLAAHQRAFIRGMQEAPAGMISGVIASAAIGMFIYWLKMLESNNADKISDNPGHWIAEGLDRSGMLPLFFQINNSVEKFTGDGAYGALENLFPGANQGGKSSRFFNRQPASIFVGPTGDFVNVLWDAIMGATDGKPSKHDVTAVKNLAPFATLPIIKSLVDYLAVPYADQKLGVQ